MSTLTSPTRITALVGSVVVLLAAGGIVLAAYNNHTTPSPTAKTTKTTAEKNPTKKTTTSLNTNTQPTNLTNSNTSNADQQATADAKTQPVTDACTLFTLTIAQQLLGAAAKASAPGDTSSLQATDTSISACAYANGSNSAQVVVRKPTSSVGISENDVAFGSNKPTDAVTVQDYGQSAYWDPSKSTLNILGSNNWYIISRSSNTQTDAEAAATLLKSGF